MDLTTSHEFVARGNLLQDNISIPAMVIGNYSEFDPDPVQCKVIPDTGSFAGLGSLWDHSKIIEFSGTLENGNEIWISNFRVGSTGSVRDTTYFEGSVDLLIEAHQGRLEEFGLSVGEVTCYMVLPPTPLALSDFVDEAHDYYADGTIRLSDRHESKTISWDSPLGRAELLDKYHYIRDQRVGIHKATVRIQECTVKVNVKSDKISSPKSILSSLPDAFDDAFFLLSFLGRRRVGWYRASLICRLQNEVGYAAARRRQFLGYESEWQKKLSWLDLLVPQKALRDGLFQELLANYQKSQFRNAIDQTVLYLFATYEKAYFESWLGTAYTALECLVAGMRTKGNDKINCFMERKRFDLLSEKVNEIISEQVSEPVIAEKLISKFRNARQNPFTDRLWNLLEAHGVAISKLWPEGADLKQELASLIKGRNTYVHEGKVDQHRAYRDLIRLRGIIELWILKLLDCPDSAINAMAFREAR